MSRPWFLLVPACAASAAISIAVASAVMSGASEPAVLATMALLGSAIGLVAGLLQTVLAALGIILARRLAESGPGRAWVGTAFTSVLVSPALVWMAHRGFSGRWARTLPWRGVLVVGTTLVLLGVVVIAVRGMLGLLLPSLIDRKRRTRGGMWAALFAVMAIATVVLDGQVLVRRYWFVHTGLELLAFLLLQVALLLLATPPARATNQAFRARPRRWALAGLAVSVVSGGALVLWRLQGPSGGILRAQLAASGPLATSLLDLARGGAPTDAPRFDPGSEIPLAWPRSASPAPHVPPAASPGADVVLITVDALRADHLGSYGHGRATSPRLDRLAIEGLLFERAYTASPHTSFSLASLLTGRHAFSLARLGRLAGHPTLAHAFRAAGYRTMAAFPPAVFFVEGELFRWHEKRRYGFEVTDYQGHEETRDAVARTDSAIRLLDQAAGYPVFLWAHYFGPHEPYVHHPEMGEAPFGRRAVDRYDEEIRWVDREIGRLLDHLARTRPGAIVVVTADHGEEFGDHGGSYHGTTLHDEQVRVPLILRVPGRAPARVRHAVSTVDVLPTLVGLVGLPWPVATDGLDLAPWFGPGPFAPAPPVFAEVDSLKMLVHGGRKLICDSARDFCRLFDLTADPGERRDLAARRKQEVASLRAPLEAWWRGQARPAAFAPDEPPAAGVAHAEILAGARRFDMTALRGLSDLLVSTSPDGAPVSTDDRAAAAKLMARSPLRDHVPALLRAFDTDPDPHVRTWAAVALGLHGETRALPLLEVPSAQRHTKAEAAEAEAYRGLALAGLGRTEGSAIIARTLPAVEDVHLRCRLSTALARARQPEALPALQAAYTHIRSRSCVANALTELASPEALPFIAERLRDEPYTTVKVALTRALASTKDPAAVPLLETLFRTDDEDTVVAAAARGLVALGAARALTGRRRVQAPADARELWLVADDPKGTPLRVRVPVGRRKLVDTRIDTSIGRDAYAMALPATAPGKRLHVLPPARWALFR